MSVKRREPCRFTSNTSSKYKRSDVARRRVSYDGKQPPMASAPHALSTLCVKTHKQKSRKRPVQLTEMELRAYHGAARGRRAHTRRRINAAIPRHVQLGRHAIAIVLNNALTSAIKHKNQKRTSNALANFAFSLRDTAPIRSAVVVPATALSTDCCQRCHFTVG